MDACVLGRLADDQDVIVVDLSHMRAIAIRSVASTKDILGYIIHLWQRDQLIYSWNLIRLFREIKKVGGAGDSIHIFDIVHRGIANHQSRSRFYSWNSPNDLLPEISNHLLFAKYP